MLEKSLKKINIKTKRFYLRELRLKDINLEYLSWFESDHIKYRNK